MVTDVSNRYAAIALVGPRAKKLLDAWVAGPHAGSAIVVNETPAAFELLVPAAEGPALFEQLLVLGARFQVACVRLDALEHLAASHRFDAAAGATLR